MIFKFNFIQPQTIRGKKMVTVGQMSCSIETNAWESQKKKAPKNFPIDDQINKHISYALRLLFRRLSPAFWPLIIA
jgi:hypothetical protein